MTSAPPDHVTSAATGAGAVHVRLATRDDMPTIHRMIQSSPAWFFALVVTRGLEVVGYALCNRAYSSWTRRALYVEDLYVRPEARGAGAGRALLRRLCAVAAREGVTRIDWHVLESNALALRFYAGLGARDLHVTEGRAAMRLDEPYIKALAAEDTAARTDLD